MLLLTSFLFDISIKLAEWTIGQSEIHETFTFTNYIYIKLTLTRFYTIYIKHYYKQHCPTVVHNIACNPVKYISMLHLIHEYIWIYSYTSMYLLYVTHSMKLISFMLNILMHFLNTDRVTVRSKPCHMHSKATNWFLDLTEQRWIQQQWKTKQYHTKASVLCQRNSHVEGSCSISFVQTYHCCECQDTKNIPVGELWSYKLWLSQSRSHDIMCSKCCDNPSLTHNDTDHGNHFW